MSDEESSGKTEIEFGGMKFSGGKMFALITALSTLGGAAWGGFEVYKDYMDMKEIIANIDITEIQNQNTLVLQKLEAATKKVDTAIEYSRDIKNDLRDQITTIDNNVRRVEKQTRETEQTIRQIVQNAEQRFENKRDALQNDYDKKAGDLRDRTDQKIKDVEDRLNTRLQKALDNPLAK